MHLIKKPSARLHPRRGAGGGRPCEERLRGQPLLRARRPPRKLGEGAGRGQEHRPADPLRPLGQPHVLHGVGHPPDAGRLPLQPRLHRPRALRPVQDRQRQRTPLRPHDRTLLLARPVCPNTRLHAEFQQVQLLHEQPGDV